MSPPGRSMSPPATAGPVRSSDRSSVAIRTRSAGRSCFSWPSSRCWLPFSCRAPLGRSSKTGNYYVFDRAHIASGPVATIVLAHAPRTDPTKGNGSISPSAFDGHTLYIAGGGTEADGETVPGSLLAYDPNDFSRPLWKIGAAGPVLGAVTTSSGVVVIVNGALTTVVSGSDGPVLFKGSVAHPAGAA